MDSSKVQEVAMKADIQVGVQQSMVPEWHQACASVSSQLLDVAQVGGLCSELRLYMVASHLSQVQ